MHNSNFKTLKNDQNSLRVLCKLKKNFLTTGNNEGRVIFFQIPFFSVVHSLSPESLASHYYNLPARMSGNFLKIIKVRAIYNTYRIYRTCTYRTLRSRLKLAVQNG